jgi:hypothetical protein
MGGWGKGDGARVGEEGRWGDGGHGDGGGVGRDVPRIQEEGVAGDLGLRKERGGWKVTERSRFGRKQGTMQGLASAQTKRSAFLSDAVHYDGYDGYDGCADGCADGYDADTKDTVTDTSCDLPFPSLPHMKCLLLYSVCVSVGRRIHVTWKDLPFPTLPHMKCLLLLTHTYRLRCRYQF